MNSEGGELAAMEEESVHTGRKLWRGQVETELPTEVVREFSDNAEQTVAVQLPEDDDARQATMRVGTWSYTEGSGNALAQLKLVEVEHHLADRLEFEGMSFKPYHYRETAEFDGQAIVVNAWVKVSRESHDRLRQLWVNRPYFPVVRVGLSDTPRSMRLGQPRYTPDEKGFRYYLVLVDEAYDTLDSGTFRGLEGPMDKGIRSRLAEQIGFLEAIVEQLKARELLSDDDIAAARRTAVDDRESTSYSFLEDPALDELQHEF